MLNNVQYLLRHFICSPKIKYIKWSYYFDTMVKLGQQVGIFLQLFLLIVESNGTELEHVAHNYIRCVCPCFIAIHYPH